MSAMDEHREVLRRRIVEEKYLVEFRTRFKYLVLTPAIVIALPSRNERGDYWHVSVSFLFWTLGISWSKKPMFLKEKKR